MRMMRWLMVVWMGAIGIGVGSIMIAAVEQSSEEIVECETDRDTSTCKSTVEGKTCYVRDDNGNIVYDTLPDGTKVPRKGKCKTKMLNRYRGCLCY